MDEIGIIHGRFQVLHIDHMKYLMEGKKHCKHLIVGICNPEAELTRYTAANPHRSKISSNPLTYYERAECVKRALLEYGLSLEDFDVVPFPINYPEKIFNYVPKEAVYYMTIYDEWGREKYNTLSQNLGLDVKVLWEVPLDKKGISATDIRQAIYTGKEWKDMVPFSVYQYIVENGIDKRIRELIKQEKTNN